MQVNLTTKTLNSEYGALKIMLSTGINFDATAIRPTGISNVDEYGVARFAVSGLEYGEKYYFKFTNMYGTPVGSYIGSFTTAESGSMNFNFAFGASSYSNLVSASNARIYDHLSGKAVAGNIDFFVHLGEMHYRGITGNNEWEYQDAYDDVFRASRQNSCWKILPMFYTWGNKDYAGVNFDRNSPSRNAAIKSFRERFPMYPLAKTGELDAVYYSFIYGRGRFIVTDLLSERTPTGLFSTMSSNQTIFSKDQRDWFLNELNAAKQSGQFIVWVNSKPWISQNANGRDDWGGYALDKAEIASYITGNGLGERMLILGGGMNAIAYDDGTSENNLGGIKVCHAAPLDQKAEIKTSGPYLIGPIANDYGTNWTSQYGTIRIGDTGDNNINVEFRGLSINKTDFTEFDECAVNFTLDLTYRDGPGEYITIARSDFTGMCLSKAVAGNIHNFILNTGGFVTGWGANYGYQISTPPSEIIYNQKIIDVAVGEGSIALGNGFSMLLTENGSVYSWGQSQLGNDVRFGYPHNEAENSNFVKIGGTINTAVAMKEHYTGNLYLWGDINISAISSNCTGFSEFGIPHKYYDRKVVDFSCGYTHTLILNEHGYLEGIPDVISMFDAHLVPSGLGMVSLFTAGYGYSLAVTTGGLITGWGVNGTPEDQQGMPENFSVTGFYGSGQLNIPTRVRNLATEGKLKKLFAGNGYAGALTDDNIAHFWGWNPFYSGVPKILSGVKDVSASTHSMLITDLSGNLIRFGQNDFSYTGTTGVFNGFCSRTNIVSTNDILDFGYNLIGEYSPSASFSYDTQTISRAKFFPDNSPTGVYGEIPYRGGLEPSLHRKALRIQGGPPSGFWGLTNIHANPVTVEGGGEEYTNICSYTYGGNSYPEGSLYWKGKDIKIIYYYDSPRRFSIVGGSLDSRFGAPIYSAEDYALSVPYLAFPYDSADAFISYLVQTHQYSDEYDFGSNQHRILIDTFGDYVDSYEEFYFNCNSAVGTGYDIRFTVESIRSGENLHMSSGMTVENFANIIYILYGITGGRTGIIPGKDYTENLPTTVTTHSHCGNSRPTSYHKIKKVSLPSGRHYVTQKPSEFFFRSRDYYGYEYQWPQNIILELSEHKSINRRMYTDVTIRGSQGGGDWNGLGKYYYTIDRYGMINKLNESLYPTRNVLMLGNNNEVPAGFKSGYGGKFDGQDVYAPYPAWEHPARTYEWENRALSEGGHRVMNLHYSQADSSRSFQGFGNNYHLFSIKSGHEVNFDLLSRGDMCGEADTGIYWNLALYTQNKEPFSAVGLPIEDSLGDGSIINLNKLVFQVTNKLASTNGCVQGDFFLKESSPHQPFVFHPLSPRLLYPISVGPFTGDMLVSGFTTGDEKLVASDYIVSIKDTYTQVEYLLYNKSTLQGHILNRFSYLPDDTCEVSSFDSRRILSGTSGYVYGTCSGACDFIRFPTWVDVGPDPYGVKYWDKLFLEKGQIKYHYSDPIPLPQGHQFEIQLYSFGQQSHLEEKFLDNPSAALGYRALGKTKKLATWPYSAYTYDFTPINLKIIAGTLGDVNPQTEVVLNKYIVEPPITPEFKLDNSQVNYAEVIISGNTKVNGGKIDIFNTGYGELIYNSFDLSKVYRVGVDANTGYYSKDIQFLSPDTPSGLTAYINGNMVFDSQSNMYCPASYGYFIYNLRENTTRNIIINSNGGAFTSIERADDGRVFVTDELAGTVYIMTGNVVAASVTGLGAPKSLALCNNSLYVTAASEEKIKIIDTGTYEVTGEIPFMSNEWPILMTKHNDKLYVTVNTTSNPRTVAVIDTNTNLITKRINVGHQIIFGSKSIIGVNDHNRIYVNTISGANVIDTVSDEVIGRFSGFNTGESEYISPVPGLSLVYNDNNKMIYSLSNDSRLYAVNTGNNLCEDVLQVDTSFFSTSFFEYFDGKMYGPIGSYMSDWAWPAHIITAVGTKNIPIYDVTYPSVHDFNVSDNFDITISSQNAETGFLYKSSNPSVARITGSGGVLVFNTGVATFFIGQLETNSYARWVSGFTVTVVK